MRKQVEIDGTDVTISGTTVRIGGDGNDVVTAAKEIYLNHNGTGALADLAAKVLEKAMTKYLKES